MLQIKNQNGFTIVEVLASLFIMTVGFIATYEMEFLALRQKHRAEQGTIATNMIQFIADRDMAEVRRSYLHNSITYMDAQAGRILDLSYCDGSDGALCAACPCDPLNALTPNPDDGVTESTCAAVDAKNFDPKKVVFRDDAADCEMDAEGDGDDDDDDDDDGGSNRPILYVIRQADTTQRTINGVTTLEVSLRYAVKTESQFEKSGLSVEIKNSLASQAYEVSAHIDDYSVFLGGNWTQVRVPHIP